MEIFEVLGDPVRRRILELLTEGPLTVGEIGLNFDISRPAISRHLLVLRESQFVSYEADAQRRIYEIDGRGFAQAEAWLARYRRFWPAQLDALESKIDSTRRISRERTRKHRKGR
jgi:DNA-binding transcriptional ArsR family regulator